MKKINTFFSPSFEGESPSAEKGKASFAPKAEDATLRSPDASGQRKEAQPFHFDTGVWKTVSDELVFKAAREGNQEARNELVMRYVNKSRQMQEYLIPGSSSLLEAWDANYIMFQSVVDAIDTYEAKAKFSTYTFACFRNRLRQALKKIQSDRFSRAPISLDEEHGEGDDTWTYMDFVADQNHHFNPLTESSITMIVDDFKSLPEGKYDPRIADVVNALTLGMKFSEICQLLDIDPITLRAIINSIKEYLWKKYKLQLSPRYEFKKK